jgi:hypothetical protein
LYRGDENHVMVDKDSSAMLLPAHQRDRTGNRASHLFRGVDGGIFSADGSYFGVERQLPAHVIKAQRADGMTSCG